MLKHFSGRGGRGRFLSIIYSFYTEIFCRIFVVKISLIVATTFHLQHLSAAYKLATKITNYQNIRNVEEYIPQPSNYTNVASYVNVTKCTFGKQSG